MLLSIHYPPIFLYSKSGIRPKILPLISINVPTSHSLVVASLSPPLLFSPPLKLGALPSAFPSTHCFSYSYHFRVVPLSASSPACPRKPLSNTMTCFHSFSWKRDSTESVISFSFHVLYCSSNPVLK